MFSKKLHSLVYVGISICWGLGSISQASAAPPPRYGHGAIYDSIHDDVLIFGGNDGLDDYLNDSWVVSLTGPAIWTPLVPVGTPPSGRAYHSAVFDPVRGRALILCGSDVNVLMNEVWELSLSGTATWTQLHPSGTPPTPRFFQSVIYDASGDRLILFGGIDADGPRNDVWAMSLGSTPTWTSFPVTGTPPSERFLHSAIYDPVRHRMVVFGGGTLFTYFNDTWALTLSSTSGSWAAITPLSAWPLERDGHGAGYDPIGDRMVIFGGFGIGRGPLNDVWTLALSGTPKWSSTPPWGDAPDPRTTASAVMDAPRNRLIVFGGLGSGEAPSLDDTWALTLRPHLAWTPLLPVLESPPLPPPVSFLFAPVPNPSRGRVTVRWSIAKAGPVRLEVYDLSGRLIRRLLEGEHREGPGVVTWEGRTESGTPVDPGIYFVRMAAPGFAGTRRLMLIR